MNNLEQMNRRLIAIYEKPPTGEVTKGSVRREKERVAAELRNEKLKKQLILTKNEKR